MKTLIVILVSLISVTVQAQKNFKDGLVVLSGGDTLKGQIDQKEWSLNPESILFRQNELTTPVKYGAEDVQYFEIIADVAYQAATVKISMDPIEINEVGVRDTTLWDALVFLKVLMTEPTVSLYSYRDKVKERFYVKEKNRNEYLELQFHRYYEYGKVNALRTDYSYRDQLIAIARSANVLTPKLLQTIQNLPYRRIPLLRVINEINGTEMDENLRSDGARNLSMYAGGGLQAVTWNTKGKDRFYTRYPENTTPVLPHLAAGIDIFNNKQIQQLIIRAELGISGRKNTSVGVNGLHMPTRNDMTAVHEINALVVSFSPRVIYNVYNTPRLKIPLGLGASGHFANYMKNRYTESDSGDGKVIFQQDDYIELEKIFLSIHLTAGIVINNKWEASVLLQPRASLTDYNTFSIGNSVIQFQVFRLLRR